MIPVSVIIVTKNEEKNLARCLSSIQRFDDVWVIDSASRDKTIEIAKSFNLNVLNYQWNGSYPKKRQYCLDNLTLKYDWVFFVDADEFVPDRLIDEIETLLSDEPKEAGFFITGKYLINEKVLKFGFHNRKISLFHRGRMEFPVVDDLDIPGMGEIEGHYQPILKSDSQNLKIGSFKNFMLHDAFEDIRAWSFRHEKYARWESGMNKKDSWPVDPVAWRQKAKKFLRASKFRAEIVFLIGYILKLGILDGKNGLYVARQRYKYLNKINML